MKRRDVVLVGLWTLASASLTVAMFWPANLEALDKTTKPLVAQATLAAGNAELTVEWMGTKAKSTAQLAVLDVGPAPVLELIAKNNSADTTMVTWSLNVQKRGEPQLMSRAMPASQEIWKDGGSIVLQGHESKTIELKPTAKLEKNSNGYVVVTVGKQNMVAGNFTTKVPTADSSKVVAAAAVTK